MSSSEERGPATEAGAVFVLGGPPWGTALVGAMIGRNPEAFGLPELNLFVSDTVEGMFFELADQEGRQFDGLLRAVAYMFSGEQTIASIAMARRWMLRRLHWTTDRVFDVIRDRVAPLRPVEKSRIYSLREACLDRIRSDCPGAIYVHLVCQPDTARRTWPISADPTSGDQSHTSEQPEHDPQQWLKACDRISVALSHVDPERLSVLQLEDLLADPSDRLRSLCRKLKLRADDEAVGAMLHPELSPFAAMGPVGANLGDDRDFLRHPRVDWQALQAPPLVPSRARNAIGGY